MNEVQIVTVNKNSMKQMEKVANEGIYRGVIAIVRPPRLARRALALCSV